MKKHDESRIDAARGRRRGHVRFGWSRGSHKHAARSLVGLLLVVFALVTASTGAAQTGTPDRLWKLYPLEVPDKQEPSAPPAQQEQQPARVAPSETSGDDLPDTDTWAKRQSQLLVTVAGLVLLAVGVLLLLAHTVGLPTPRRPAKRNSRADRPGGVTLAAETNKGPRPSASTRTGQGTEQGAVQTGTAQPSAKTPANARRADAESPPERQKENETSNLPDPQEVVEKPEARSGARESEQMLEEVSAQMNEEQGELSKAAAEDAGRQISTMEEDACEAVASFAKATQDSTRQATDQMLDLLGEHAQQASSTVEAEIEQARRAVETGCEEAKAAVIEVFEQTLAVLDDAARTLADHSSIGTGLATRSNSTRSRSERTLISIDNHAARAQAVIGADGHESLSAIRAQAGEIRALADSRVGRAAAAIEAASERARAAIHAETASVLVAASTEAGFPDEAHVTPSEAAPTAPMTILEEQIRTHVDGARAAMEAHAEEMSAMKTAAAGARSSIQAETERAVRVIRETVEQTAQTVTALVVEMREAVDADTSAVASELEHHRRVERARGLLEGEIKRSRAAMEDELERTIVSIQATVEERLAALRVQEDATPLRDDPSMTRSEHGEASVGVSEADLTEDLALAAIQEAAEATTKSFRAEAARAVEVVTAETARASDQMPQPTGTSAPAGTVASEKEGESSPKFRRKRRRHGRPR